MILAQAASRCHNGRVKASPRLASSLPSLAAALALGCSEPATPPTADAAPDIAVDAAPDVTVVTDVTVGTDVTVDTAPDAPARDLGAETTADATPDVAMDARPDAAPDVAPDAPSPTCAGAVAGGSCAMEGSFCGGPCTNPCQFCNVLRCAGGRWERLEAPPLPLDMCRDAGPDASDAAADASDAGGIECNPRAAACDALPPPCMGGGEVREVRGGCWGECVVYTRCRPIPCDPAMTGQCPTNTVCFRTTRLCGLPVM